MHRFRDGEALPVGPVEHRGADSRHLPGIGERFEVHEFRARGRLEPADHVRERDSHPRDHHRPRLDAAHAVDPLLQPVRRDEILEVESAGFRRMTAHLQRPRPGLQRVRAAVRVRFPGAKLEEVVVGRDLLVRVGRFVGAERARCHVGEPRPLFRRQRRGGAAREPGAARGACRGQEPAPVEVVLATGDLGRADVVGLLDQHRSILGLPKVRPPNGPDYCSIPGTEPPRPRDDGRAAAPR